MSLNAELFTLPAILWASFVLGHYYEAVNIKKAAYLVLADVVRKRARLLVLYGPPFGMADHE